MKNELNTKDLSKVTGGDGSQQLKKEIKRYSITYRTPAGREIREEYEFVIENDDDYINQINEKVKELEAKGYVIVTRYQL